MNNKDIFEYVIAFMVVAILVYRKYGRKYLAERKNRKNIQQNGSSGSQMPDDDYEPYSGKGH
jgi:hypothetical protein